MVADKIISIEIVYASSNNQKNISLQVEEGCSIERAIDCSGILLLFPEIDLNKQKVGVFSKFKKLSDKVFDGDRIEIYRPLLIDPKEARRKRVK